MVKNSKMERLKQHPDLTIAQVANKYGLNTDDLRDEQLQMLRNNLKRDNTLWDDQRYGR